MDTKKRINELEKEISLLCEEEYKKKIAKSNDKTGWILGISGFFLSSCLINAVYELFSSNRVDNVTRAFLVLGIMGIGLIGYALKRERDQEKYIHRLQEEIKQKQNELNLLYTIK